MVKKKTLILWVIILVVLVVILVGFSIISNLPSDELEIKSCSVNTLKTSESGVLQNIVSFEPNSTCIVFFNTFKERDFIGEAITNEFGLTEPILTRALIPGEYIIGGSCEDVNKEIFRCSEELTRI